MRKLWVLLQKRKSAREAIALLVPIVIAIGGGFWAVFTYVFPADKPGKLAQPTAVTSGPGGVAVGRDISGSTISVGPLPSPAIGGATTVTRCPDPSSLFAVSFS